MCTMSENWEIYFNAIMLPEQKCPLQFVQVDLIDIPGCHNKQPYDLYLSFSVLW